GPAAGAPRRKKPPHRVRLPAGASHDRRDGGAARPAQQSQHPRLLRIRSPFMLAAAGCLRPHFGWSLRLGSSRTFALGHPKLLSCAGATSRRHHLTPAEAHGRWRGRGANPSGLLSVTATHALLALKVQRKVSNGVAGLAAAGSSLDRPKIAAVPAPQRSTHPPRK